MGFVHSHDDKNDKGDTMVKKDVDQFVGLFNLHEVKFSKNYAAEQTESWWVVEMGSK